MEPQGPSVLLLMVRMQEELLGNSAEPHELSPPYSGPFARWGCSICGRVP